MQLSTSRATATILPDDGRLASLIVDDLELLVTEGAKPTRWGSFPMAPWAGRLAFGHLYFADRTHEFRLTSPPHANHGTVMHQSWTVVESTETTATLRSGLGDAWPFGGSVEQRFSLTDDHFEVAMTIEAEDTAFPAQLGWHPWYRRQLDRGEPLTVEFAADSMYSVTEAQLPTGELVTPPEGPWDDTFTNVTQQPILRWADALTLELTSDMDHWVVFTRPEHAVAIEPQSGAPNDLNRDPHIIEPGGSLSGWMRLSWTSPEA